MTIHKLEIEEFDYTDWRGRERLASAEIEYSFDIHGQPFIERVTAFSNDDEAQREAERFCDDWLADHLADQDEAPEDGV